jgi:hypothetical protein
MHRLRKKHDTPHAEGVTPEGRRHSSAQLHWPLRRSAMISLLSLMSALIEAPEDILNLQDHCLRPKGFIQAQLFAVSYIATSYLNPFCFKLSDDPLAANFYAI